VSADLTVPASGVSHPGWVAVEVGLDGVGDEEPRDDARWFTLEVSPQPSVVLLASPPDWDSRFLARTLSDVARVPVRTFVESEPDGGGWRDAANLTPVSTAEVTRVGAGGTGGGARRATVAAAGLFRWAFRGGASAEAYRAVVAALADWLLAGGARGWERFVPVTHAAPNGMPVAWRWTGAGSPRDVTV